MSTPTTTAISVMSSFGKTLSSSTNLPFPQQRQQLSPPPSYKSDTQLLTRTSVAMDVTNNSVRHPHNQAYRTSSNAGSSVNDLHTPPTPPLLALSSASQQHQQMQPLLPSLPSILEPPFAPSSSARFTASTVAAPTASYPTTMVTTTSTTNGVMTTTPFASSTSVDSIGSSTSTSPLYHCRWRHCFRSFHGPELLYQHLCDDHVGRHARGNLCLECHWEDCQTVTNKRDHITSHLRVHVPLTPLRCRICDKRYKRRQDLKKHERKHMERLELPNTQLANSELSVVVNPLSGTVLPDTHSRHATTTAPVQHHRHHPYSSAHPYPPSASSSTTSLRSGSPGYRPITASSVMPPSLPSANLHPHHLPSQSSHQQHAASLPLSSHSNAHYPPHHHPILPALTPNTSVSPPSSSSSSFSMTLNGNVRGGNFTSPSPISQSTAAYPSQPHYAYPPSVIIPSTSMAQTSNTASQQYAYSSQPSHLPTTSNSLPAPASLSQFHYSQPALHLPLPNGNHPGGYPPAQPASVDKC